MELVMRDPLIPSAIPASAAESNRLYFIDNLRIAAIAILIVYHVGMYYVTWDFHIKSPFASTALEPWMMLSSPWRMSLLFMVSGAATAIVMRSGAQGAFLHSRTKRLLWPLLVGMVLVVPPQSYVEVSHRFHFTGDYLDFLKIYFSHRPWRPYPGFCEAGKCLVLPTWNHLWFLPYLWAYSMLLYVLTKVWPCLPDRARLQSSIFSQIHGIWLMFVPVAALVALRWTLAARFPQTHAFTDDWFMHAMYLMMFLTGAIFAHLPGAWLRLEQLRWAALGLALAAWLLWVLVLKDGPLAWRRADISLLQWSALVAAFGFAHRHWNRDHPLRARLTEAVFPLYILHQTAIIVLAHVMRPLGWRPVAEAAILIAGTFFLSWLGYLGLRHFSPLRAAFGMAAK
jgi:glucans biosynthesis protein C